MKENPFESIEVRLITIDQKIDLLFAKKELVPAKTNIQDLPQIGGIELAVRITGYKKSTIYKLTASGKIPYQKPGGKLRFRTEDLMEWVQTNSIKE